MQAHINTTLYVVDYNHASCGCLCEVVVICPGNVGCSFSVQTVMAPVSHLLVYYVTRAGEPISDVITFDVKLLQKKVRNHSTVNALYRAIIRSCLVIIFLSLNSKWLLVTLVVCSIFQTFFALRWFFFTNNA